MNIALSRQIDQVLRSAHIEPAVTIILPFNPKMSAKHDIAERIQYAAGKAESLLTNCPDQAFARLVSKRLKHIINNLNYSTFRKSLAIYVSPVFEKVLYLDVDVEEKVVVDGSFEIRDIVYAKKEDRSFLLLFVGAQQNTIWLSNGLPPVLLQSVSIPSQLSGVEEADRSLENLLKYYPFPVLVAGKEEQIQSFKAITHHKKQIGAYLPVNTGQFIPAEYYQLAAPAIREWKQIHQKAICNRIGLAAEQGLLAKGIGECWKKSVQNIPQLLVVERNFLAPSVFEEKYVPDGYDHFSCVKDPVDDLIEKVLSGGGDVEFVEDGSLASYEHLVLLGL